MEGAGSVTGIKSYRDLLAWQKGMDLVVQCYRESSRLPTEERYGLRAQMRRSAVSIPSNIAEGWGRRSRREYLRFLRIAQGSIFELLTQVEIAQRLGFSGDWASIRMQALEAGRVLYGLAHKLQESRRP